MKIDKTESSACKLVFRVELAGDEFARQREKAWKEVTEHANLPGFRKGKAPAHIIEQKFGKEIEHEAVDDAVSEAAREILSDTTLVPITQPTVSAINRSGGGLTFSITVEIAPEIRLGEYQGLELTREPAMVRPEDVDAVIDNMRRRNAVFESATRPARWGDMVVVDYEGICEGKPLEGGSGKDVTVMIGSGQAMASMESSLTGHNAGDNYEFDFTYPAGAGNMAGKTVTFRMAVKEVKSGKLPDLNDEFARAAGGNATLEELRKSVVDRIRAQKEKESLDKLRDSVVERLLRFAPPEVAPSMVDEEMGMMAARSAEELRRQGVRSFDELHLKPSEYREMFRVAATRSVREAFVLDAIMRAERIEVTEDDMEKEIRSGSGTDKAAGDRLISQLKKDGRWERLRHKLMQDRTLDWVIGKARITEKAVCP
jgi:trigger factor